MERQNDDAVSILKLGAGRPVTDEADTIQLRIPGLPEYISVIREAVEAIGEQIRLPLADRAAVKLAVGEACNNAVQHARDANRNRGLLSAHASPVDVFLRVEPDALEIDVMNQGNGFHPGHAAKMPEAELLDEHGRGRALMEMMMDSVQYLSIQGNTVVRMRKNRPPQRVAVVHGVTKGVTSLAT